MTSPDIELLMHQLSTACSFFKTGSANISNVQFIHSGQKGYTNWDDPRYSVSFVGITTGTSYVKGCSFSHGYSAAIGAFSSDGIHIENNVVHGTWKTGKCCE